VIWGIFSLPRVGTARGVVEERADLGIYPHACYYLFITCSLLYSIERFFVFVSYLSVPSNVDHYLFFIYIKGEEWGSFEKNNFTLVL